MRIAAASRLLHRSEAIAPSSAFRGLHVSRIINEPPATGAKCVFPLDAGRSRSCERQRRRSARKRAVECQPSGRVASVGRRRAEGTMTNVSVLSVVVSTWTRPCQSAVSHLNDLFRRNHINVALVMGGPQQ